MDKNFKYTSLIKKTNIDLYIFIICGNFKKNIENIKNLLNINKIPKKIFNDYSPKEDYEKKLMFDNYEILFISLKEEKKCDNNNLYKTYGKLGKDMSLIINKNIFINLVGTNTNIIRNQVISYMLGFYEYTEFKTSAKKKLSYNYFYSNVKKIKNIIENSIYEANIQNELRSLINIPANILNSEVYSKYIQKNINNTIKFKVLNESKLKKLGCNLILGVNKGSKNKPMMIVLEYGKKTKTNKTIALIGKSVMFDAGGLNIKHGNFSDMKQDMTGSAIVYGIFKLLSQFNIDGHFIGLLPLVENMVDANSTRPGDILKAYNGKTVEIIDTDAEGRLIMADALAYSTIYKPYMCIDIATLTGQAGTIFDNKSSIVIGNNNKYIQKIIQSGIDNNEKIWELPMWEEYIELTKSNIADLKNYSYESKAGTIMAGAFLSHFIPSGVQWLHLDIAGVDSLNHNTNYRYYGATGEIMRSLFGFLKNFEKESYEK
jgi:leucyl aminopeptidase